MKPALILVALVHHPDGLGQAKECGDREQSSMGIFAYILT
jgi:hypothetical protein